MKVKRTDWATQEGISYTTTCRWAKAGKNPSPHQAVSGRPFVEVEADSVGDGVTSLCARLYRRRSAQKPAVAAASEAS